jgi:hypothetical protein
MNWIFNLLALAAAYFVTNEVVKGLTGKSIPQHVCEWWNELRDLLVNWAYENDMEEFATFFAYVDTAVQGLANMQVLVHDSREPDQLMAVHEEEVSLADMHAAWPELKTRKQVELQVMET